MANFQVNRNVYNSFTRAIEDKKISAAEMQEIRTEMEASGQIDAQEQAVLQRLESGAAFTLRSGSASVTIDPKQLSFPSAATSQEGITIGTSQNTPVRLGRHLGTCNSEREAMRAARAQYGVLDDPDVAIIQSADGKYQLHTLEMPNWISDDGDDFNSYKEIRNAQLNASLPKGSRLIAVISDENDARFFARESSPNNYYPRPANPAPITPALSTSEADRQARVHELRASAYKALDRLKVMENDLGSQRDHRGIFATMYRVITERAIKEMYKFIEQGDWRAAEFEGALLVNFANRYFDAYDNYSRGNLQAVPEVWRSAFDAGRNAEAAGYNKASVTEIVALSMVAHILNDLPQTLRDIGYNKAIDRQGHLQGVYDGFNKALMEEKPKIMGALSKHYGFTDVHMLDVLGTVVLGRVVSPLGGVGFDSKANNAVQSEIFTWMRTQARDAATSEKSAEEIRSDALKISDRVRTLIPGGN